ncbi:MAG: hypothetical protein R3B95_07895 [Nitrospirales bacterium]|nr:class I SAM-dependent methyltransferase [Nitrospirales bacterium]
MHLLFLIRAAESVQLPDNPGVVVIADYGSSQGKILEPMKAAITAHAQPHDRTSPIAVFHNDQPANDFSSLFQVMESVQKVTGTVKSRMWFSYATGRSFYERLFPTIRSLLVGRPGRFMAECNPSLHS